VLLIGILLVVMTACGGSTTGPTPAAGATPAVVAFGDSLTAGPGIQPTETYPVLLQQRARAAGYAHRFINAGVSGDTTGDALRRVDAALSPDATVVIVALGANDAAHALPVSAMRANLAAIIERAQARGLKVLLCGLVLPPINGAAYSAEFNSTFPELAERYRVALMPFMLEGVAGNPALNLSDGVHPNAAGHRVMADAMWPYLEPLLR
jgi:acyl-CoA thioesterase-1